VKGWHSGRVIVPWTRAWSVYVACGAQQTRPLWNSRIVSEPRTTNRIVVNHWPLACECKYRSPTWSLCNWWRACECGRIYSDGGLLLLLSVFPLCLYVVVWVWCQINYSSLIMHGRRKRAVCSVCEIDMWAYQEHGLLFRHFRDKNVRNPFVWVTLINTYCYHQPLHWWTLLSTKSE